jgi:hypothetical protein
MNFIMVNVQKFIKSSDQQFHMGLLFLLVPWHIHVASTVGWLAM